MFTIPVTITLPVYKRPQRTRRILECLANQTMRNFELIMIGDACPEFRKMTQSQWFDDWARSFRKYNHLFWMNFAINRGGWGFDCVNWSIRLARGTYFCWANNDDVLMPEHIEYYYKSIDRTGADFVYNPSYINGSGMMLRDPTLKFGSVGHSELVVKTSFLKKMPPHENKYGQDWTLISNMIAAGAVAKKGNPPFPTYCVMSMPNFQEEGID